MGLNWWFFTMVLNSAGALAYATKFPEKYFPNRYDIVGGSHQIMHVLVVAAGLTHTTGMLKAFDYNHDPSTMCMMPS
jgi:adiponectin receptor